MRSTSEGNARNARNAFLSAQWSLLCEGDTMTADQWLAAVMLGYAAGTIIGFCAAAVTIRRAR